MSVWTRLLLAFALVATPVYAKKPHIQWNPSYDFSAVEIFQWRSPASASRRDVRLQSEELGYSFGAHGRGVDSYLGPR
jgi:hypothetical protein